MTRFDEQLKKIQELRKQREVGEGRLYASQLELYKIENLLRQSNRNEAIPSDKAATDELRSQIVRLQTRQHELNGQPNESDGVLEKIRENESQVQFLKDKIAVTESQWQDVQNNISETPEGRFEQFSGMLIELKLKLEKAEAVGRSLSKQKQEAIARREKITAEKNKLRDEIATLESRLSASAGISQLKVEYERLKKERSLSSVDLQTVV